MTLGKAGIGYAALEQIKSLVNQGCQVEVICAASMVPIEGVTLIETQRLLGQRIPQRLLGMRNALSLHDRMTARHLRRMPNKPDIVHTWPLACEATLREARRLGVLGVREAPNTHTAHALDIVAREHDRLGVTSSGSHAPDARKRITEAREYSVADLILVPSEWAIETFTERGVARSKLAIKSYGFDPARYPPTDKSGGDGPVRFTFIGSCEPRKGLHIALEAWLNSGVADTTRMRVLGRFVPGYLETLSPWLAHPNVELMGFVDDLAPIYAATDVLVLPSIEEGSALVTYEAQGAGCALLVSRAAGARFVTGEQGLIHDVGDVAVLAGQIAELAKNLPKLRQYQQAAARNAQGLTWERATSDLIAIYQAALAQHRIK